MRWRAAACVCVLALASGCARYHPQPLNPPVQEQELRSRRLAAEPVDLAALVAAARQYSPEVRMAQARARTAEGAILTAKPRPNPSLSLGGGYTNSPESALVFHFDPALTLETAGKRGLRILEAQKLAEAARLMVAEAEWLARSRVRAAWSAHWFARQSLAALESERRVRAESVEIMEKRLAVGDVSRPDVDLARSDLIAAEVALEAARGSVAETLATLAAAAGLPVSALEGRRFAEPAPPPPLASLQLARVQTAGLLHRVDVRRALVEYAAAEAALQLEIARQYPDVQLMPGYGFDEGHHKISIGPGFTIPVFHRNQGPIAEAEGRRAEAAARFTALQAQAIADMETALAQYRGAMAELAEAERQVAQTGQRENDVERAIRAGQEDRLTLAGARLQSAVAVRARVEAQRKARAAWGALGDAVQQPLEKP